MEALEAAHIDDPHLDATKAAASLWRLIDGLEIVDNQAKLVSSSKALHHLLPDLVPPIDRMYTQEFFLFHPPEFQYGQQQVFAEIWDGFVRIARTVDPASYVGDGWRTSRSKVIDNAIVAYVRRDAT